jgi:SAM-dependent methyltransferase
MPGAHVTCWDINYTAKDLTESLPGTQRVRERPEGEFDIVLAMDVIEHVPDDAAFLRDLRRVAHSRTLLVVTVPAYQALFTKHDVYLGHYRRYSQGSLLAPLASAGWVPLLSGGFFITLLPVRAATALLERASPAGSTAPASDVSRHLGTWRRGRLVTGVVQAALAADARLARRVARRRRGGLPGLSLFLVARPAAQSDTAPA